MRRNLNLIKYWLAKVIVCVFMLTASACGDATNGSQPSTLVTVKQQDTLQTEKTVATPLKELTTSSTVATSMQKQSDTFERSTSKEAVYLTFDGGPGPRTPEFLEALKEWDAKATFFVTGSYTEKDPEMLKRIVAAGHTIANHSWDHPDMTKISDAGVRIQLERTQHIVKEVTSIEMVCWRPPFGATNTDVQDIADSYGLTNAKWIKDGRWDVDTIDWREGYDFVLKRLLTIEGGDVVLMHSGNNPDEEDLAALTTWMETNKDSYRFEALPGC